MKKLAIISVSDKAGLEPFARGLVEQGVTLLSTGGTAAFLRERSIPVESISDYTGSPEILEGRVKTLHPKIHGGILARRDRDDDMQQLGAEGIAPIDFVIVNLYPFPAKVKQVLDSGKNESLIEHIDIGGPTMLRAAAKNCAHVAPVIDPADYPRILEELKQGSLSKETRFGLAQKVFTTLAAYDGEVARYFSLGEKLINDDGNPELLAPVESIVLTKRSGLRYGENPHQQASFYRRVNLGQPEESNWRQLQGKELSYNNLVDLQAALELLLEFYPTLGGKHVAIVIKHTNPCGVALRSGPLEAFQAARACDPVSIFGGIIALTGRVEKDLAESILEQFVEIVICEDMSDDARVLFEKKKNLRLIQCDYSKAQQRSVLKSVVMRDLSGEYLLQTDDQSLRAVAPQGVVTEQKGEEDLLANLQFAWQVSKHVKSNAIVVAKNFQAIGVGAGQMSRVDSAKIALDRAETHEHNTQGSVAASDAFLPFSDTLEVLNNRGVVALVQPGGSIKDEDVIKVANEREMVMVFTSERHFRH